MWSDSFQVSLVKLILVLQAIWNFGNCNGKGLEELGEKLEEKLNRLFHLEKEKQLSIYNVFFFRRFPGMKSELRWEVQNLRLGGSGSVNKSLLNFRPQFPHLLREMKSSCPGCFTGLWGDTGEMINGEASWSVKSSRQIQELIWIMITLHIETSHCYSQTAYPRWVLQSDTWRCRKTDLNDCQDEDPPLTDEENETRKGSGFTEGQW